MHSGLIVWSERPPSSSWPERKASVRWFAVVIVLSACLIAIAVGPLATWQADSAATLLG